MKKYYFAFVAVCFLNIANGQIINFPDANFKAKLLAANSTNQIAKNLSGSFFRIDSNYDYEIQVSEAVNVAYLDVTLTNITSVVGIKEMINLQTFICKNNYSLQSLDVTGLVNLTSLDCSQCYISNLFINNLTNLQILNCYHNNLSSLNLNGLPNILNLTCNDNHLDNLNLNNLTSLKSLSCQQNLLMNLDVSALVNLESLVCSYNQISNLNLSNLINLTNLNCQNNQLVNLTLSNNINLQVLSCANNQIISLNTSSNPFLNALFCSNNQITSLDLSNNFLLLNLNCQNNQLTILDLNSNKIINSLNCRNNQLTKLFIKNGTLESTIDFLFNLNLNFICADDGQIAFLQNEINQINNLYYFTNCQVNNYCSFTPGGTFYTIRGNNKLDLNNNGCDVLDIPFPNMKYNITSGVITESLITNNSGNYSMPVGVGTHTITPMVQNPTYFNISPPSATIAFPTTASPAIQNFCITPNGNHQDVAVTILPINPARPGFDATYKIIYNNKGNVTVSGTVNFTFSDAETDFVSATPNITSQNSGTLYWDYTNLLPFEKREITVVLNLNSPQETPALVAGNLLNFESAIEPISNDEASGDNIFEMQQTVVNSMDPNDKTCLEGNNIVPAKVGDYVHYIIRFENTGTFAAQNIVVKDIIDTSKFDIATLLPINGSHDFETRINGDKVEFIFQNINLPFDNANNDGYVAFKIKTKSTLVLGNTFSNSANIYFDYNFPIVTNTATTTVANPLANQDFVFNDYIKIYPNPAKNVLNIENFKNITISSISLYNVAGQVLQVITNPKSSIDVSDLKTGNYFMKIVSDKGTTSTKFIKE